MKKDEIFGINERYGVVVPPAICVLPQTHPCYRCVWLCHTDVPFCMLPAGSSLCRHSKSSKKEERVDMQIKRGDVYYADLNPVVGSEQGGIRPVVIIQNNIGNRFSGTTVVIPISSAKKPDLPVHITVQGIGILEKDSVILAEQIRTIDNIRIKNYIGTFDETTMKKVDRAIKISLGVDADD